MVDQELEAALCAPDWATSLMHVHNAQAALAAKEAENAELRAKVERLRDLVLRADEWRQPRKWHEDAHAALTETSHD